jgi:hypothetical protein
MVFNDSKNERSTKFPVFLSILVVLIEVHKLVVTFSIIQFSISPIKQEFVRVIVGFFNHKHRIHFTLIKFANLFLASEASDLLLHHVVVSKDTANEFLASV